MVLTHSWQKVEESYVLYILHQSVHVSATQDAGQQVNDITTYLLELSKNDPDIRHTKRPLRFAQFELKNRAAPETGELIYHEFTP